MAKAKDSSPPEEAASQTEPKPGTVTLVRAMTIGAKTYPVGTDVSDFAPGTVESLLMCGDAVKHQ